MREPYPTSSAANGPQSFGISGEQAWLREPASGDNQDSLEALQRKGGFRHRLTGPATGQGEMQGFEGGLHGQFRLSMVTVSHARRG